MSSFTQRLSSALQPQQASAAQQQQQSSASSSSQQQQQHSFAGDGKSSSRRPASSILDRPLLSGLLSSRKTVETIPQTSLSAFSFLLSEMVQYTQKRVSGIPELEDRLADFGRQIGWRLLELICWREYNPTAARSTLGGSSSMVGKREVKFLPMLMFIHTTVWKQLFGRSADSLERSTDNEDEYMISDNEPLLTRFISVPKDFSQLNCGAFIAGVIESMLEGSQFPATVTAHNTSQAGHPQRTTILIKFHTTVMEREKILMEGR